MNSQSMNSDPIVLIGLPGSGKSTLVDELADRLGRRARDLDRLIEDSAGASIEEIFATKGEAAFRRLEAQIFAAEANSGEPVVIASGGGLVTSPENVALLRHRCLTVWLNPPLSELTARLAQSETLRPLLTSDEALRELYRQRIGLYSIAADVIVTESKDTQSVASEVLSALEGYEYQTRSEQVDLSDGRSYEVLIGSGVTSRLAELLPSKAKKAAVVTQREVGVDVDSGLEQRTFFIENGESAKRLEVVGELASRFAAWGLTRGDVVVSVGGGVVSDLAGFAAASYHRGVAVVHVSTTLLGQIDAAIGGKTGVNLPEGKNLVGAFWQPNGVICDSDHLTTLPPREFRAGMGELAKYHFLGGGRLDGLAMTDRVAACVRIKADVVSADEREGGRRAILNYGHTLAHALETSGKYGLRHGEAVAVGLVYAAELALALGRVNQADVDEHRRIVEAYGLDATLPNDVNLDELVELFGRDKKAVDGITFVLDGPNGVEPIIVDDEILLRQTLEKLR